MAIVMQIVFRQKLIILLMITYNLRLAYKYYDIQTDYSSGKLSKPLTPNHRFFANISYETKQLKLNNTMEI